MRVKQSVENIIIVIITNSIPNRISYSLSKLWQSIYLKSFYISSQYGKSNSWTDKRKRTRI